MLEDLFSEMDLCVLNDGTSTYIHPATGSTSALDLSICGPSLVIDYEWTIHEDLCGSDHFPVCVCVCACARAYACVAERREA